MTGAEAWRLYEQAVDTFVARFPPRERHKYTGKLYGMAETFIRERFGTEVWEQYRDARYKAGYHR
jgi:hypothetical protein